MQNNAFAIINLIDRVKLPFRKDKELYSSLYDIIGLYPHNISYYKLALMHKSVMHRNKKGKPVNNERLEFLGDAILDAAVGDIVYRHFPGKREGFLTNTRSKLVQRDTLNKLAQEMGINKLILSSGHSASHNSYLGGILAQMINIDKVAYKEVNFKSKLIEWSQKNKVKLEFKFIKSGKDNGGSPTFCYQVMLEGIAGCTGDGFSKKESQQKASKDTLELLRKKPQFIDEVFAAKGERTKMEEEPVNAIPSTDETQAFMVSANSDSDAPKHATAFREKVYTEQESAIDERHETVLEQPVTEEAVVADEFDLSDISAKAKSREEIIAEAEKQAFRE